MASDDARAAGGAGGARFSAKVARAVCARVAAGESQSAVCADPDMPNIRTLRRWALKHPAFAARFGRARALGGRAGRGGFASTYCPELGEEIAARVSEGETLTSVAADPAMPSMRTILMWRHRHADFAEALTIAREALAERLSDLGWRMAMDATPETLALTRMRLGQLRWTAAVQAPHTHARLKPAEPPLPPAVQQVTLRTFRTEVDPATGRVRGVALHFDPEAGEVVREMVGEWQDPAFPLLSAEAERRALGGPTSPASRREGDRAP